MNPVFSIQICTKNRIDDLRATLTSLSPILARKDVECLVFDDGSTDGTSDFVRSHFPEIILRRNDISKGYLFCRNALLNETRAEFALTFDDDATPVSADPLRLIRECFDADPDCGVIALRIFWGRTLPENRESNDQQQVVRGFVGCGHAWRMSAWRKTSDYPEWFGFYGEETFATLDLFRQGMKVVYLPSVLVHHRVDMKERRMDDGFNTRYRRSLRADWYLYFMFYPWPAAFRFLMYSLWMQARKCIKSPVLIKPVVMAVTDLIAHLPTVLKHRTPLSNAQFNRFMKLPPARIYWNP